MTRLEALTDQITKLQTRIARDKALGRRTGALESHLCALVAERMRARRKPRKQRSAA